MQTARGCTGHAKHVRNRADLAGRFGSEVIFVEVRLGQCRDQPLPGAQIEDRLPLAAESTGVSGLAERYAAALFELADERHALDEAAHDLRELRAMLAESGDLLRLVDRAGEGGHRLGVLAGEPAGSGLPGNDPGTTTE